MSSAQGDGDPGLSVCEWRERKDFWFEPGCVERVPELLNAMAIDGIADFKFCPFCGKELREVPYAETEDQP